jgi:hypothetical protein
MVLLAALGLLLANGTAAEVPGVQVERTEFGGSFWSDGQRRAGVLFQDGAQSIPLPGGALWLFGDTFFGAPQPGQPPQNSQIKGSYWTTLAWLPAGMTNLPPALEYFTNSDGMVSNSLALLPGEDPKHRRIWPGGGIGIGSRIYLYYSLIATTDEPGPWNFHGLGGGLSVSEKPLNQFTRLQPGGQWQFPVEPIQVILENDLLYLLEISSEPKGLVLARVETAKIEDPAAYRFFAGNGWSTNRADAKVILREAYGQVSVMRLSATGDYLMATSSDFTRPHEIQLYRSKQLEGPWGSPCRITVPEMPGKKTNLIYCTYFHPELSDPDSGRVVVTFCRVLDGDWSLSNPEWAVFQLAP